jgi:hypothetical protein
MKTSKYNIKGELLKKINKRSASSIPTISMSEQQYNYWETFKDRNPAEGQCSTMPGEIWSTRARSVNLKDIITAKNETPYLVLLLDVKGEVLVYKGGKYQKILVAPISTNLEMATEWDFVVSQEESPLGYPFMIEMWNKVTMLAENLHSGLARFDDSFFEHILRLSQAESDSLFDESQYGQAIFKNNIGDEKVAMGNEIYHFQRKEVEEMEYLIQPVKALSVLIAREQADKEPIFSKLRENNNVPCVERTNIVVQDIA